MFFSPQKTIFKSKFSAKGITDDPNMGSDGEDDIPRLPSNADGSSNREENAESGKQVDLFSEIHLNELKKLEKQLEQVIYPRGIMYAASVEHNRANIVFGRWKTRKFR